MVRRYCVHNGLRFLWTLTLARQDHQRGTVVRDVQAFARRLQRRTGPLPYLYVLEAHRSGAWHVHIALPRWISHSVLEAVWGHGWVFVTDHGRRRRRRRVMPSGGQGLRSVAGYVAKYVSKAYEAGDGRQGYGVAEGHQPPVVLIWGLTERDVRERIAQYAGGDLVVLDLTELDGYDGPPAFWACWADP
jgi:hypothetical protein